MLPTLTKNSELYCLDELEGTINPYLQPTEALSSLLMPVGGFSIHSLAFESAWLQLTPHQQRQLVGNGMSGITVGSMILVALCTIQKRPIADPTMDALLAHAEDSDTEVSDCDI